MLSRSRLPRNSFEAYAISYGRREALLFSAWALPLMLVIGAPITIIVSFAVGENPWTPIGLLVAIAPLSLLGWLVTIPLRFTSTPPRPVDYPHRVAQKTAATKTATIFASAVLPALCLAVFLFTPKGRNIELLLAYPMVIGCALGLLFWTLRVSSIIKNCPERYAAWLTRTGRQPGPPPLAFRVWLSREYVPAEHLYADAIARG